MTWLQHLGTSLLLYKSEGWYATSGKTELTGLVLWCITASLSVRGDSYQLNTSKQNEICIFKKKSFSLCLLAVPCSGYLWSSAASPLASSRCRFVCCVIVTPHSTCVCSPPLQPSSRANAQIPILYYTALKWTCVSLACKTAGGLLMWL